MQAVEVCGLAGMIGVLGGIVWMLLVVVTGSTLATPGPALLVRESVRAATGNQRGRSITRQRLNEALDTVATAISESPLSSGQWAGRLAEIAAAARTVTELARAVAEEDGAPARSDAVVWAEALRASVESHAHDLDTTIPWARLFAEDAMSHIVSGASAMESHVASLPALADLPDRCEAAVRELKAGLSAAGLTV